MINRRDFFKLLGAGVAAVVVPVGGVIGGPRRLSQVELEKLAWGELNVRSDTPPYFWITDEGLEMLQRINLPASKDFGEWKMIHGTVEEW